MEKPYYVCLNKLRIEADDLKRITTKVKQFKLPKLAENILLVVSCLGFFDVFVAAIGAPYLSENIGAFLGKSRTVIVSDLLFLEGTIILTIGIFIWVVRAWEEPKKLPSQSKDQTIKEKLTGEKRVHFSTQMIIVGAILIGLSIIVGMLPR